MSRPAVLADPSSKVGTLLLTVEEAAQHLGIGRSLAWRLVRQGALPSVRLGRLVRVPQLVLDEWIARQCVLPEETNGQARQW